MTEIDHSRDRIIAAARLAAEGYSCGDRCTCITLEELVGCVRAFDVKRLAAALIDHDKLMKKKPHK